MMLLPRHDLVFLAYNKAGSSSIEAVLRPFAARWAEAYARVSFPLLNPGRPWKHMSAAEFDRLFGLLGYRSIRRVAVVRNPWDRLVSVWSYQRQSIPEHHPLAVRLSFADYVRAGGSGSAFVTFQEFAAGPDGANEVETVMRMERLDDDFAALCAQARLSVDPLPRLNASERPHYREMYTGETAEIVAERFAADIETFGYSF